MYGAVDAFVKGCIHCQLAKSPPTTSRRPPRCFTKGKRELRHYGTTKPRAYSDKPYVCLLRLDDYEVLAHGFVLGANGTISAPVPAQLDTKRCAADAVDDADGAMRQRH